MTIFANVINWSWITNAILPKKKKNHRHPKTEVLQIQSPTGFRSPWATLQRGLHFKMPAGSQARMGWSRINGAVESEELLSICPGAKLPPQIANPGVLG